MKLHISIRRVAMPKYLNQTDVHKLSGISRNTINGLWTGKNIRNAHFDTIEKLAAVLNCSPLDFFYVTEDKE